MNDSTDLERRYRRLLAFYPKAFRREREQEILSVLMAGARAGQQWPRLAETTDLVRNAIPMRLQRVKQPTCWERRHPGPWILGRVLIGIWLAILTAILCQYGHWWGLALLAPAALQFYLAYRVAVPIIESEREAGGRPSPPPPALGG
jgi:hypothetical protein